MDSNCIFCKIVAGEIPSTKLFETDSILAFMDIGPIAKGHALVIPKEHYQDISSIPDSLLYEIIQQVKKLATAQLSELKAEGVNVTQANGASAGQVVPHIHFHVIPRFSDDGCLTGWNAGSYDSVEEMDRYASFIRNGLASQLQIKDDD